MRATESDLKFFTQETFVRVCNGLRLDQDLKGTLPAWAYYNVLEPYNSPSRHYHDAFHIDESLGLWAEYHDLFERPNDAAFALMVHDVIYEPLGQDNEGKSADWALSDTGNVWELLGLDRRYSGYVRKHVYATTHSFEDQGGHDTQVVCDIDLARLGADWETFQRHSEQIRQEYIGVPIQDYCRGRANVLERFLKWNRSARIYHTSTFESRFGHQARENLTRAVAELRTVT